MRTIRISDAVWDQIARRGKFGETEDDVLRRVFDLPEESSQSMQKKPAQPRQRYATNRMHADVHNSHLVVSFADGPENRWPLPERSDKAAIRSVRDEAVHFALENGASDPGQTNAVRKALTNHGFHLTK